MGRQFNANQLIVAEVLQSAESMKFAVAHLEPHMDRMDTATKGKVVLATVKGDVHDIGKNLVEIILSNNGYDVVNLGIKVPPQDLIEAYREHRPDIIGLSGLLVKSAQMMVETARDFRQAGVDAPILVGGAALSNRFTRLRIGPEYDGMVVYSQDAMTGLALANTLQDADERQHLAASVEAETEELLNADQNRQAATAPAQDVTPAQVRHDFAIPTPPDLRLHVLKEYDLERIFPYINPQMLYVRHLGTREGSRRPWKPVIRVPWELRSSVRRVEDAILSNPTINANAVFKFFPCQSDGHQLLVYSPDGSTCSSGSTSGGSRSGRDCAFPTMRCLGNRGDGLRRDVHDNHRPGVRELSERWKAEGEFLNSHILQVLGLEGAEGFAELLHQQMRQMWGIEDPPGLSYTDLFRTQYMGGGTPLAIRRVHGWRTKSSFSGCWT